MIESLRVPVGARRALSAMGLLAAIQFGACATVPVRTSDTSDYVYPAPERGDLRLNELTDHQQAWQKLLAGQAASAEKRFRKLRARHPLAAAPETALGYALMRAGKLDQAEAAFLSVVSRHPRYVAALAGAGAVFRQRGDPETAAELLRRAVEAGGSETPPVVRRRLGEAKLEVTETRTNGARRAREQGRTERAQEELERLLRVVPELAGIRLELAELFVQAGQEARAIEVLAADPGDDRQVLLRLGALQLSAGQPAETLRTIDKLLTRDPQDDEARRLRVRAENDLELMRMPEEYRRILVAPRITRADLAALVSVKVTRLTGLPAQEPPVATDISGSWARAHILQVLACGILEVYPNHTFQPAGIVRRSDLAQALSRALDIFHMPARPLPALADVPAASLYYDAAARAVAEGLMDVTPARNFEPWRSVTGPEAAAVVDALDRLLRLRTPIKGSAPR